MTAPDSAGTTAETDATDSATSDRATTGPVSTAAAKPRVAVWKFSSCDGCQLTLLDCEDELLAVADAIDIVYFLEATSAHEPGPYDLSIVEGSVATPEEIELIREIRAQSTTVIAIGACATAGGIQALRNYADVQEYASIVYAHPEYISTLADSHPISEFVKVDFELRGCPIHKEQLLQLISSVLVGSPPALPTSSVCLECKARGTTCLLVSHRLMCLGPVTMAGCGALCPAYGRGCFGCHGPADTTNIPALVDQLVQLGHSEREVRRLLDTYTVAQFREDEDAMRVSTEPTARAPSHDQEAASSRPSSKGGAS